MVRTILEAAIYAAGVSILAAGCQRAVQLPPVQTVAEAVAAAASLPEGTPYGDYLIGEPIQHANLTIFPIASREPRNEDRFITLDEGLKAGTVKVFEIGRNGGPPDDPDSPLVDPFSSAVDPFGPETPHLVPPATPPHSTADDSPTPPQPTPPPSAADPSEPPTEASVRESIGQEQAEVNRLMVLNTSDKPLYLMPGEIISGGYQDRTIGVEVVLEPNPQPAAIDVYCVERGRWSGREVSTNTANLVRMAAYGGASVADGATQTEALEELAKRASQGEFVAAAGQLSLDVRKQVAGKEGQGATWQAVNLANVGSGAETPSDTFAENYTNEDVTQRLAPYLGACRDKVEHMPQVIGVVVAINGEVEGVDLFESTPLFLKFWPKLVQSYALDASVASDDAAAPQGCPLEKCTAFLKEAEAAQVQKVEDEQGTVVTRRESPSVLVFHTEEKGVRGGSRHSKFEAGGLGGVGGDIHVGGFAK